MRVGKPGGGSIGTHARTFRPRAEKAKMRKHLWSWLAASLIVTLISYPLLAEERLTSSQLRSAGIEVSTFQPIAFSHNDRWLAGFDRAPFEEKLDEVFYRLWFIPIDTQGRPGTPRKVPLKLRSLQQGEFAPNDREFIVMGDRGTRFIRVSMSNFQVSELMEPRWGEAGFRSEPAVLWTESGTLYAIGHPYDRERFVSPTTIAAIDPNKSQHEAFTPGPNLTSFERGVERLWFTSYLSPTSGFIGQRYPDTTIMSFWNGERLREFERSPRYHGFWSNSNRLLYSCDRSTSGQTELILYDADRSEKRTLASDSTPHRYVFLSRNGKTAQASTVSQADRRLIPYYAKESDQWEMKPVLTNSRGEPRTIAAGWIRISSRGDLMAHVSVNGLAIYSLD